MLLRFGFFRDRSAMCFYTGGLSKRDRILASANPAFYQLQYFCLRGRFCNLSFGRVFRLEALCF